MPAALPEENAGKRSDLTGSNGPGGRQLPARAGTVSPDAEPRRG
jgi:hypothetical protein